MQISISSIGHGSLKVYTHMYLCHVHMHMSCCGTVIYITHGSHILLVLFVHIYVSNTSSVYSRSNLFTFIHVVFIYKSVTVTCIFICSNICIFIDVPYGPIFGQRAHAT